MELLNNYLKDGQSIFIFPEGTRNKSGENNLLPFKDGAFRLAIDLQVPILPQVYINTDYIMPYKPLLMRPARIDVYYLDPISTEGLTMQDLQNLKEQVRSVISEEYNKRIKNN
jgi:1-acyl-sn-glycerol-3-phosphate acyltransferase